MLTMTDMAVKIDSAEFFKTLRKESPVFFDEGYNAFIVTRYEDIKYVLKEANTFSSARALFSAYKFQERVEEILNQEAYGPLEKVLPMTDPPQHTRLRALVNTLFIPRRMKKMEGFIENLADELMDQFIDAGRAEIVSQFALPLPVTVISNLLGLPNERWQDVIRWQKAYSSCAGNYVGSMEEAERYAHDLADMQKCIVGIIEDRRNSPGDDVMSELIRSSENQTRHEPLNLQEMIAIAAAFIAAGHDSTTIAITNLIKVLADNPDAFAALQNSKEQEKAIIMFVEEVLRLRPPLNGQIRIAAEDAEIDGVKIPVNSKLIVAVGSANQDEDVFGENSDTLDIGRKNAVRHVSFGSGIHVCLGAPIARLELQIVTKVLLRRLATLKTVKKVFPVEDYRRALMDWNYALSSLEVEFIKRD